jgi:hypothetical protein
MRGESEGWCTGLAVGSEVKRLLWDDDGKLRWGAYHVIYQYEIIDHSCVILHCERVSGEHAFLFIVMSVA